MSGTLGSFSQPDLGLLDLCGLPGAELGLWGLWDLSLVWVVISVA